MTTDSTDKDEGNSFEYRLKEVSDEEIVSILRLRNHFQPHALKAAVREAIKRGIIFSVDDLESDEFKPQPFPARSIFPISPVERQNLAIFKSLCRISYGIGIIPAIFGIFQIADKKATIGVIALLIGLLVIYITFKLERERKLYFAQFLLSLNIPAIVYATYKLSTTSPTRMDIAASVIIVILMLYTTLYIYKLTTRFNRNL